MNILDENLCKLFLKSDDFYYNQEYEKSLLTLVENLPTAALNTNFIKARLALI